MKSSMFHVSWHIAMVVVVALLIRVVSHHETKINELSENIAQLSDSMEAAMPDKCFEVRISAYTPSADETDSDPDKTATMEKPVPGGTAAVSRDLVPKLMGRTIYIPGLGVFKVNDVMHSRFTQSVDICVGSKTEAKKFGLKNHVVIIIK